MKKPYEKPEVEITVFEVEDICTSGIIGEPPSPDGADY